MYIRYGDELATMTQYRKFTVIGNSTEHKAVVNRGTHGKNFVFFLTK